MAKNSSALRPKGKSLDIQEKPKTRSRSSFNMPVKILVIGGKKQYYKTVCCSVGAGLCHMTVGALTTIVLLYAIKTGDIHAILCCAGYQCLSAEAILCLIHANGWSAAIRHRHRKCVHVFLQLCSLACAAAGTIFITNDKGISYKGHGLAGIITSGLAAVTVLTGIPALCFENVANYVHLLLGISTFAMSSICLGFALFTPAFTEWAGDTVKCISVGILLFYSFFIIISALCKFASCI